MKQPKHYEKTEKMSSFGKTGAALGISTSDASRTCRRALRKLRDHPEIAGLMDSVRLSNTSQDQRGISYPDCDVE